MTSLYNEVNARPHSDFLFFRIQCYAWRLCTEKSSERVEWRTDKVEGGGLRRTDKVEGGAQLIVTVNWGDFIAVYES